MERLLITEESFIVTCQGFLTKPLGAKPADSVTPSLLRSLEQCCLSTVYLWTVIRQFTGWEQIMEVLAKA